MTPRRLTMLETVLGTSMPTMDLPGTGASMRMVGAARASARSLASEVMRSTLTRVRETSSRCEATVAVLVSLPDLPGLDVPARLHAELRHGRAGVDLHHLGVDAVAFQRLFDAARPLHIVRLAVFGIAAFIQYIDWRQAPAVNDLRPGRLAVLLPDLRGNLLQSLWCWLLPLSLVRVCAQRAALVAPAKQALVPQPFAGLLASRQGALPHAGAAGHGSRIWL